MHSEELLSGSCFGLALINVRDLHNGKGFCREPICHTFDCLIHLLVGFSFGFALKVLFYFDIIRFR